MVEISSSGFAVTPCTVHHLIRFEGLHGGDIKCEVCGDTMYCTSSDKIWRFAWWRYQLVGLRWHHVIHALLRRSVAPQYIKIQRQLHMPSVGILNICCSNQLDSRKGLYQPSANVMIIMEGWLVESLRGIMEIWTALERGSVPCLLGPLPCSCLSQNICSVQK